MLRKMQGGRRVQHREHDGPVRGGTMSKDVIDSLGAVKVRDVDARKLLHGTFADAADIVAT
jgi:hypothetical protein